MACYKELINRNTFYRSNKHNQERDNTMCFDVSILSAYYLLNQIQGKAWSGKQTIWPDLSLNLIER